MRRIVFSIAFFRKKLPVTIDSHIDEIEMEVLRASWTSEFSHSLDPKRTSQLRGLSRLLIIRVCWNVSLDVGLV